MEVSKNKNEHTEAIESFLKSLRKLKDLEIMSNQKDFTSQIGEWIIATLYGADLAKSGNQKGWDMSIGNEKIQVKSHAKAKTTPRAETDFKYSDDAEFDIFVIVIFDESYKIKNIYKIPKSVAMNLKLKSRKEPVIVWTQIPKEFDLDLKKEFASNELLSSFI